MLTPTIQGQFALLRSVSRINVRRTYKYVTFHNNQNNDDLKITIFSSIFKIRKNSRIFTNLKNG